MDARLWVLEGSSAGSAVPLQKELVVGRDATCNLQPDDLEVSRRHCTFSFDGKGVVLTDLGSANGTFLNGQEVHGAVPVKDGDQVKIGGSVYLVQLGDANAWEHRVRSVAMTTMVNETDLKAIRQQAEDESADTVLKTQNRKRQESGA